MNTTVRAIETRYRGYRFRSRLEARWAVFFDALGITWRYEIEGFDLPGAGHYLPDFWVPALDGSNYPDGAPPEPGCWVEIKPSPPSQAELRRLKALATTTGHVAYLIAGDCAADACAVWQAHYRSGLRETPLTHLLFSVGRSISKVYPQPWTDSTSCTTCGATAYCGRPTAECNPQLSSQISSAGNSAFVQARSARFEHGESPVVQPERRPERPIHCAWCPAIIEIRDPSPKGTVTFQCPACSNWNIDR